MKVGDENMIDALKFGFEFSELQLGTFSAVEQKKLFIKINQLWGWVSSGGRSSGSRSKYGNIEPHQYLRNTFWAQLLQ